MPPDREKWVSESLIDGKIVKTEIIYIGLDQYKRENSQKWLKTTDSGGQKEIIAELVSNLGEADEIEEDREFSLKKIKVGDEEFTVIQSRSDSAFGQPGLYMRTLTIDKNGRIVKEEDVSKEGDGSSYSSSTVTTTIYDLKDIKIEPPIN